MMADLIDRQAAYETLTDYYHHRTDIQHMALHEALNKVPSADVQPVRHGRWLDGNKNQPCSVCKYRGKKSWNYCPNCGARMDEAT